MSLNPDLLGRIAFALEAALQFHEQADHDGERCEDERTNVVAFFAHRLGVGQTFEQRVALSLRITDYALRHEDR